MFFYIFVIYKFYSQIKTKYINDIKKKEVIGLILDKPKENTKALLRKANSLPNIKDSLMIRNNMNKRRLSIQINVNCELKKVFKPSIPTMWIVFETMKCYLLRSNFIIIVTVTFSALCMWFSVDTPNLALIAEKGYAYFVPIFLFLTEPKLRDIFLKKVSRIFNQI